MPYKNVFNRPMLENRSMAASFESESFDLSVAQGFSIHAKWTGSPVGTIKLQILVSDVTGWEDLADSEISVPNATNTALWNVSDVFYDQVKIVFTRSSGSGSANAYINAKGDDNA